MFRSLCAAAVLSMVFAIPGASAADATIDLTSDLPITVTGDATVTAEGAFVVEGDGGDLEFAVDVRQGSIERVLHRSFGIIDPDQAGTAIVWENKVDRESIDLQASELHLGTRAPEFVFLIDNATHRFAPAPGTGLSLQASKEPQEVTYEARPPIQFTFRDTGVEPFRHTLAAGDVTAQASEGTVDASGAASMFIGGASITYAGPGGTHSLHAGHRVEEVPGSVYDPVTRQWRGGGSHTEYVYEILLLHLDDAESSMRFSGGAGTLFAEGVTVQNRGDTHFPDATGHVVVQESGRLVNHTVRSEDLHIRGDSTIFLGDVDENFTRARAQGHGDVIVVQVGQKVHEYDWTPVAVGTSAVALVLFAWLLGAGKWLATLTGWFPGYARVEGDQVLEHPFRQRIFDFVRQNPGKNIQELTRDLESTASTIEYHVRVLERNDLVSRVKDGRAVRVFDRTDGGYTRHRKEAAAVLRRQKTADVAKAILEDPGITQRELMARLSLPQSTLIWHLKRLLRHELIMMERQQRAARYYAGEIWDRLPDTEVARLGLDQLHVGPRGIAAGQ